MFRSLAVSAGTLLRATTLPEGSGVIVALSGSPVELVVGTDIGVRFLQTTIGAAYAEALPGPDLKFIRGMLDCLTAREA